MAAETTYSVAEAARWLGAALEPLRRAIRTGELRTAPDGTIRPTDLDAWLETQRVPTNRDRWRRQAARPR